MAKEDVVCMLFSCPIVSDSLQPHGLQHARPPCPSPSPEVCPSSCPLHRWCHPAILSSDSLFLRPQSFPASGTFPMSQLFMSDDENIRASASASVLQWVFRVDFPEDWLVWSPCCPGEFQESSPAPQFKGTTSLAFCLLYCPALTTVHDHWEYYSLDYTDLRWQSNVSVFQHTV